MAETVHFTIGARASCSDGTRGEVTRVIIDPVAETVQATDGDIGRVRGSSSTAAAARCRSPWRPGRRQMIKVPGTPGSALALA